MSNADLIEELRWQLRQIEERKADNARRLAAGPGTTVTSPDGTVTVLATPEGMVTEVRLTPEAMRTDAPTLSRAITEAIRAAAGVAPEPQRTPPPPKRKPAPQADDEPYDTVFDI